MSISPYFTLTYPNMPGHTHHPTFPQVTTRRPTALGRAIAVACDCPVTAVSAALPRNRSRARRARTQPGAGRQVGRPPRGCTLSEVASGIPHLAL